MKKAKIKRRKGGTLSALAGMLIASAIIRISVTGSIAIAETDQSYDDMLIANEMIDAPTKASRLAMLEALQQREADVSAREIQVNNKSQALAIAKADVQEQIDILVAAEENLRATIALADVAAENDLLSLTAVYENMKPKDAAALFAEMSPEFAAGFLGLMRAESAALIMTGLEPNTAYSISVILAGRNANVSTN